MVKKKVDNTPAAFAGKLALRLAAVHGLGGGDQSLRILDAYAGAGRLWRAASRHYPGQLEVLGVDMRRFRTAIKADNRRVLASIDLARFDLIDLDAYGIPAEQADILGRRGYRGPVIWTVIQKMFAVMPATVTDAEGIPREWRQICPTLFSEYYVDSLARRWCAFLDGLGWGHHAWLQPRATQPYAYGPGRNLYGISTVDKLPLDQQAVHDWYERLEKERPDADD
jgi:hypothetical protein